MPSLTARTRTELSPPRPFLKWAGGKGQLLEQFQALLPQEFGGYFEPFVGGGALFFALQAERRIRPKRTRLTDVNAELVACYRAIRDELDGVIAALSRHRYEKDYFYAVREQQPSELSLAERAARTIFLNKSAFNGLYRVNSRGQFNVPFGRHVNPLICDRDNLAACSRALQGVSVSVGDFSEVLEKARPGDFVYFDPPYVPVSDTAYFTAYAPGGFPWERQQQLAEVFHKLGERKVLAMLSNSDVPELRKLYRKSRVVTVSATRRINSITHKRGKLNEIVVLNY